MLPWLRQIVGLPPTLQRTDPNQPFLYSPYDRIGVIASHLLKEGRAGLLIATNGNDTLICIGEIRAEVRRRKPGSEVEACLDPLGGFWRLTIT